MHFDKTLISCGVYQMKGLSGPTPENLIAIVKQHLSEQTVTSIHGQPQAHQMPPFIIFSDVVSKSPKSGGEQLAKYIKDNKLGTVMETEEVFNPSILRNKIKVYIWHVDYKALGLYDKLADEVWGYTSGKWKDFEYGT